MDAIAVKLRGQIYWLESEFHDSSDTAAVWDSPSAFVSFPICSQRRLPSYVVAMLEVVVDEVLKEHLVHVGSTGLATDREDVIHESTKRPFARLSQRHDRRSNAPLALSKVAVGGRGQHERWPDTPYESACLRRREEESRIQIAKSVGALIGELIDSRLIHDRRNNARNHV